MNKKYIAFFDLDDTILSVNSGKILIKELYRQGVMSRRELYKAYRLSILHKLRLKSSRSSSLAMIQWLKGTEAAFMQEFSRKVIDEQLLSSIRPKIKEEIDRHQNAGGRLVIVSAALTFIVKPLAEYLNFDDYLCSDPEIKKDRYTGQPKGPLCIDDGKEEEVRNYCLHHQADLKDAWFYGDSWPDRFALKIVGHPVCVAPDRRLRRLCEEKGWGMIG